MRRVAWAEMDTDVSSLTPRIAVYMNIGGVGYSEVCNHML
jgi:hypothetical protein